MDADDQLGYAVSINAAGNRIAVAAPYHDGSGFDVGQVKVFNWNGTIWVQYGQSIDGEATGDEFGSSIAMNAAGDRLIIGAKNSGTQTLAGHSRVFTWSDTTWVQLGDDLEGENIEDYSGNAVAINASGDVVAIGATRK